MIQWNGKQLDQSDIYCVGPDNGWHCKKLGKLLQSRENRTDSLQVLQYSTISFREKGHIREQGFEGLLY